MREQSNDRRRRHGDRNRRPFQPRLEQLEDRLAPATLPPNFAESVAGRGLRSPTAMEIAPDGRIFVAEQGGTLRVIKNGQLLTTPFVSLNVNSSGERGLLGVAFDPNFASNQYVYVYYTTASSPIHNRVSRFTANGDVAVPGSQQIILELNNLTSAQNHNGGAIHFGTDGKLYVAVGDNATPSNAQSSSNLLGKMLRINPDGSIPTDNPFYNQFTGQNRAIWAMGLRNPYTFAVQPGTGLIYINDVGQHSWEEINVGGAGRNYGWPDTEGPTNDPRYHSPLYAYTHDPECAITGGSFYNPATDQFPAEYVGDYFFADHCAGWIRRLDAGTSNATGFATGIDGPVDLKVGADGSLYYLERYAGRVMKVVYTGTGAPHISTHPEDKTVTEGDPATFTVSATGAEPLSYQWQRNGIDIPNATSSSYTINPTALGDDGAQFRVIVTNTLGQATSNTATLTVTPNHPPVGRITLPVVGTTYAGGQTIRFRGVATDEEEGPLSPSAFTWQVDFHHDDHVHPFMPPTSGIREGTFDIPTRGETSANVYYRIIFTVRDPQGLTHTTFRDVNPQTAEVRLATNPAGLTVTLDGQPMTAPLTFTGVAGIERDIGAPSPQLMNGQTYEFVSWSDGGAAEHTIRTPGSATTYTARYRLVGTGTGLQGRYYDNMNLTNLQAARLDPQVRFDWGRGSPDASIDSDTFSVRWTGLVQAQMSQSYTFHLRSDDGVRLWIDGRLRIDNWGTSGLRGQATQPIQLAAGRKYSIVLQYRENRDTASVRLDWSSPSTPRQTIPTTQLYPPDEPLGGSWQSTDVGASRLAGHSGRFADGAFSLTGGGSGISGLSDSFQFAHQSLTGDGQIVARLVSLQIIGSGSRAGLMIRDSLAADAPRVFLGYRSDGQSLLQSRTVAGGGSTVARGPTLPGYGWLRLIRAANEFQAAVSTDGVVWTNVGSVTVPMGSEVYIGLAATGQDPASLSTSLFDQVAIT